MTFPELAATTSQPHSAPFIAYADKLPQQACPPQSWTVSVADAKYHWYDLIAGFPDTPDIRDPVGRYLRRMQFELDAAAEQHHLFSVVTRPRVRFDSKAGVQWGFFSLKLTLPLLMGADEVRESLSIELKVPFAATIKKPGVSLTDKFLTLNWGGLVEAFSVHDVLRQHARQLKMPSKVLYVGQTRDGAGRLGKGRLPALQKLHQQHGDHVDMLILVQKMAVDVVCSDGDPALQPRHAAPAAAAALQRDRMDIVEAALIRYFEGAAPRYRNHEERSMRRARLHEAQMASNLAQLTIDLQLEQMEHYRYLCSEHVASAQRHLLSCDVADGEVQVSALPLPHKKT